MTRATQQTNGRRMPTDEAREHARCQETLAFVGLGRMGAPLANHLNAGGWHVLGVDPDPSVASNLRCATTLVELDQHVDVVLACVPGPSEFEQVARDAAACGSDMLINLSTVGPEVSDRVAQSLLSGEKPIRYVESPISGGVPRARERDCVLLCGATSRADLDRAWGILECLGRPIVIGSVREASVAKLVNNVAAVGAALSAIEAMELGVSAGLDLPKIFSILESGTANSYVVRSTLSRSLLAGEYRQGFSARLALKDLRLALQMLDESEAPMLVAAERVLSRDCETGLANFFFPARATRARQLAAHVAPLAPHFEGSSGGDTL